MSAVLPVLVLFLLGYGMIRKVPVMEEFCAGVKDGLQVCLKIFPNLVLVLASVAVFRSSGALDQLILWIAPFCSEIFFPAEILPLALIRPLSGSGALSVCEDLIRTFGPDSQLGRTAAVLSASTETTFYTLSVYLCGAKECRLGKFLFCAILCDIVTVVLSVFVCRVFF